MDGWNRHPLRAARAPTGLTPRMRIDQEEIFGPVLSVVDGAQGVRGGAPGRGRNPA